MALSTTTGNMNSKIRVKRLVESVDSEGYPVKEWDDVFSDYVWCYWINAAGAELNQYDSIDVKENATITMRYTNKITVRDRVWLYGDPFDDDHAFEIVNVNNAKNSRKFLELKVRRVVEA